MGFEIDEEAIDITKVPKGLYCRDEKSECPYFEPQEFWCAYTKDLIIFNRRTGEPIKDKHGCPFVDNKDKGRINWCGRAHDCDDTVGFRRVFRKWQQKGVKDE